MRILVIEDDEDLGCTIRRSLLFEGYSCEWVKCAEHAQNALKNQDFDVVILDWMLPGQSGLALLKALRGQQVTLPVLMLTANTETKAKVSGLDAGADDYLTKPFELDELLARIRALGRRQTVRPDATICCKNMVLDLNTNRINCGNGPVQLSKQEAQILNLLFKNADSYVSKLRLESYITQWAEPITENAVEAHISRIRKKIGRDHIVTLRGVGYRIG